jgi:hypothetical protein
MREGILIIGIGCVVVMGILLLMVYLIDLLVWIDERLKARVERAKAKRDAEPARLSAEVVAIGLALHQFLEEREMEIELTILERPRYSGWTSSGRLDIMAARQRIVSRR